MEFISIPVSLTIVWSTNAHCIFHGRRQEFKRKLEKTALDLLPSWNLHTLRIIRCDVHDHSIVSLLYCRLIFSFLVWHDMITGLQHKFVCANLQTKRREKFIDLPEEWSNGVQDNKRRNVGISAIKSCKTHRFREFVSFEDGGHVRRAQKNSPKTPCGPY